MKTRQEIKEEAREMVAQQRGTAILVGVIVSLITFVSGRLDAAVFYITGHYGALYWLVYWVGMGIIYVASVNMIGEYLKIYKGENASAGAVFSEMGTNFGRKLGGMFLMTIYLILWFLLLIIPGIIKTFSYFFAPNILADCPNVSANQAIKISMRITQGHKWEIFVFVLSFLGWWILSIFTLGILAILYVNPYFYTADAGLYLELKNKALEDGIITYEDLGMEEETVTETPFNFMN